jgi:SAM-dependent methyltransferase
MSGDPSQSNPLRDENKIVSWIAEVTDKSPQIVRARLQAEYKNPGSTVAQSLKDGGLEPYTWSDDLIRYYEQTDAFLYELVIWNLNRVKVWMRRAVARHLMSVRSEPLNVLNIGDGLGFDSVHFARQGHRMTYFEVPGYTEAFARRVFDDARVNIDVLTDPADIPRNAYDAIVCLDVLEHVPDPPAYVRDIATYLRPGGTFIVNAPFMVIHHTTATHLKSNRRFSGSLTLYEDADFKLMDGEVGWNPIVLRKMNDGASPPSQWTPKRMFLRLSGCFLALGRCPVLPLGPADRFRRMLGRWFD